MHFLDLVKLLDHPPSHRKLVRICFIPNNCLILIFWDCKNVEVEIMGRVLSFKMYNINLLKTYKYFLLGEELIEIIMDNISLGKDLYSPLSAIP